MKQADLEHDSHGHVQNMLKCLMHDSLMPALWWALFRKILISMHK